MRKALSAPLLPSQQQAVLAHLDADPQLVHALRLQPQQLPVLVEHTPVLAYHILLRMLGSRQVVQLHQVGGDGIAPCCRAAQALALDCSRRRSDH